MICPNCHREIGTQEKCPYCGYDNIVSVMTPLEKEGYDGTTIDEENGSSQYRFEKGYSQENGRSVIWNKFTGKGWLAKLTFGLILLAGLAFFIFVALPFISIALLSAIVMYFVFRFFR